MTYARYRGEVEGGTVEAKKAFTYSP